MISAKQPATDVGLQTAQRGGVYVVQRRRQLSLPYQQRTHLRRTPIADLASHVARAALPWLCLLIAVSSLALVFQLAVEAHPLNAGSPSVGEATDSETSGVPNRSQPVTLPVAPYDDGTNVSVQGQCYDMSKRFPADVLVSMTMEELNYLESTLCPSSFDTEHSYSTR
jgi:hypothetical protein